MDAMNILINWAEDQGVDFSHMSAVEMLNTLADMGVLSWQNADKLKEFGDYEVTINQKGMEIIGSYLKSMEESNDESGGL